MVIGFQSLMSYIQPVWLSGSLNIDSELMWKKDVLLDIKSKG